MTAVEASSVSVRVRPMATGHRFGMLTIVGRAGSTKQHKATWLCLCDCGQTAVKSGVLLRNGETISCGCRKVAAMREGRFKSGARRSPDIELRRFYAAWCGMKARCRNPKHKDFKYYGAIGVDVCERWDSFDYFKLDMWPRPENMTLDRKDPTRGYEPDNCRWATHKEQRHNRRGK